MAAPAPATAAEPGAAAPAAQAPAAPLPLDAQISAKLVEVFGDDAKPIKITVVEGKAILTGKVGQRSTQELAKEVVLFFPEVKKVDNQLAAATDRGFIKGQLKDETADGLLEKSAKSALSAEIGDHAKNVEVEAVAGVVSLRGTVPDDARRQLALGSIAKVKGVTKTIDLLRVK